MGDALKRRLKQPRFETPLQEAMLNLMVATDHVRSRIDRVCEDHGITHGQYNVLRILRGAYPDGHPRCEIAERMIERAPDVTRLVDRLERQGLVERDRSAEDRRLSISRITKKGLRLVETMVPEIELLFKDLSRRINRSDCLELSRICETLYNNQ